MDWIIGADGADGWFRAGAGADGAGVGGKSGARGSFRADGADCAGADCAGAGGNAGGKWVAHATFCE